MNRHIKKLSLGLMGATLGLIALVKPAHAAQQVNVDITVSIIANKSLAVNTTYYDFAGLNVNVASVSVSAVQVENDSLALVETYTIQGSSAVSLGSGTNWALASATGTDVYALSAQFGTAQPTNLDASWTSDALTYAPITATTGGVLGNGTALEAGSGVNPNGAARFRNLWFRIKTPGVVSDNTQRKATLTLAVL